jgi:hypothetical protein
MRQRTRKQTKRQIEVYFATGNDNAFAAKVPRSLRRTKPNPKTGSAKQHPVKP